MCDGTAGKAPDFGLKSHVKARGLQGDDRRRCCVGSPISADFGCFSTPVSTAGGRRDPGALPMYRPGTAITSDRPLRPLGARHRSFPSASASFDLLYLAIVRTKAKIRICLKFALDLAASKIAHQNRTSITVLRLDKP